MVPSVATSAASLAPASGRCSFSVSTVAVVDITYLYRNVPARATTTRTIRISIRPKPRFTGRIVLRPAGHGPPLTLLLDLLAEVFERFACLAPCLADGLLRLAGRAVRVTFGFEISIVGHLTRFLLHVTLGLLDFAFHLVLVHDAPPWAPPNVQRGCQRPPATLFLLRAEHRSASLCTSLRKTWHHSRETQHAHDHHRPRIARDRCVARSRTNHDHADADADWADDTVDRVAVPDRAISRGIVDGDAHTYEPDTEHHDARHDDDSERHDRGDNDANVDTNPGARHVHGGRR